MENNLGISALLLKIVGSQINNLLWCARAFDRHGRLREYCGAISCCMCLNALPGISRIFRAVVGTDIIFTERLTQTFDLVPITFQARTYNEIVVTHRVTIFYQNAILFCFKTRCAFPDPGCIVRNQMCFKFRVLRNSLFSGTNQGKCRLIIMNLAGFNQTDSEVFISLIQRRCDRNACGTTTHDHYIV